MLKTGFMKLISVNEVCISSLHKLFNSFFVFSKGVTSTIKVKPDLSSEPGFFKCISGTFHLSIKICSQFHSFLYTLKQNTT